MKFIPSRKALEILGVHENTLRRWANEGKIRHIKHRQSSGCMTQIHLWESILKSRDLRGFKNSVGLYKKLPFGIPREQPIDFQIMFVRKKECKVSLHPPIVVLRARKPCTPPGNSFSENLYHINFDRTEPVKNNFSLFIVDES
jgi:hypothetical protein